MTLFLLFISVNVFALPQDSIIRATFVQTKYIKALNNSLVSEGKVLLVKDKGIVRITESPAYIKEIFKDNFDFEKRFNKDSVATEDGFRLNLSPKSAAVRKNLDSITVISSSEDKFIEVLIYSGGELPLRMNFVTEIPTDQHLSKDEELYFEED